MRIATPPPALSLLIAGLVCVATVVAAVLLATATPWLGLRLSSADAPAGIAIVAADPHGPAARLGGRALLSVGGVAVRPGDVMDEPDYLPDYWVTETFFARQTRLHRALSQSPVQMTVAGADGRPVAGTLTLGPRPLASLPLAFWVQLGFGVGSFLVGAWVWSLRPRDLGAIMFALSGVGMLVSTFGAGVYTTRELALDGSVFRALSAANHTGPMLFGFAMISLFLVYPRRLVPPKVLWAPGLVILAGLCADLLRIAPTSDWGVGVPMLAQMAVIAVAVAFQWRATRSDPVGRTALRWLGLLVLVCSVAAIPTAIAPMIAGTTPPMAQAYAFGFFFLIYVGLAVGLRRSRVFQLDEWAFRIAFYAGAGLLLALVDGLLIWLLGTQPALSLGVALLAIAFLYLPLREWLWRRLVARRKIGDEELFGRIVDTALAAHPAERSERWRDLLTRLFDPLQIEVSAEPQGEARILDDGMALALPATHASPALVLRAPWAGRGLFGPSHLRLAKRALDMVARTETGLDAYERGAAEERRRIAQDLHDDVGALLLSGLHKPDLANTRQVIRDAIFDVRTVAAQLAGQRRAVGDLLADLRHETRERLEAAGLVLDWPPAEQDAPALLDFAVYKAVRSSVRELVSNVIRHAGATRVAVAVNDTAQGARIEIADDGRGLDGAPRDGAMGLTGVARRMQAVAGSFELRPQAGGVTAVLIFPV